MGRGQGEDTILTGRLRPSRHLSSKALVLFERLTNYHPYTAEHSQRVADLALRTARQLGLHNDDVQDVLRSALFHDVGKLRVPLTLLDSSGQLTENEWKIIRSHSAYGEELVLESGLGIKVARAVRSVHERFDGQGYPDRLAGENIPMASRIIAIADAFDVLTVAGRHYHRQSVTPYEALQLLWLDTPGHFDPDVLGGFETLYDD